MSFSEKDAISLKKINSGYVLNVKSDMNFDEALQALKENLIAHSKLLSDEVIVGVHNHHFDILQKGRLVELFGKYSSLSVKSLECIDMYESIDKKNDELRKKRKFSKLDKFRREYQNLKADIDKKLNLENSKVSIPSKEYSSNSILSSSNLNETVDSLTLFHRGTIRSGNILQSKGHLIIFGDVNEGAELYAVGNIVVMGSLKGMAHAGCEGDEKAFIIANQLKSTQIRISKHISIKADEDIMPHTLRIAEIVEDNIVIK